MAREKATSLLALVFLLAMALSSAKPRPSTSPAHKKRGIDHYTPPHPTPIGGHHHLVSHDPAFVHIGGTPAPFLGSPALIGTPAGAFLPHDHVVGVLPPAPTLHEHFHHHVHEVAPVHHAPVHHAAAPVAVHHPSYVVPAGGVSVGVSGGAAAGGLVAVPGSSGYGPVLGVYHGVYHGYGLGGPTHHPALTYG